MGIVMSIAPGGVRDAILTYLSTVKDDASLEDIRAAVSRKLGEVPSSSVRSYLNENTPKKFARTGRGRYKLKRSAA
jgi:hypothetical protein